MGSEPRGNCALFQARLASQLALRIVHQALQIKADWQARLIPASQFGVEFSNTANSLA